MHEPSFTSLTFPQATKGVSALYDAVESLFDEIKVSLERVIVHLPNDGTPRTPPSTAVMSILMDIIVEVLTAIAIATKYCDLAVKDESWFKRLLRAIPRRTSEPQNVVLAILLAQRIRRGLLSRACRQGRCQNCAREP